MLHDLYYLKDIANNSHPFQPSPINKISWQRHETRHLFLKNSLSVLRTFKVIEKKKKNKKKKTFPIVLNDNTTECGWK